MADPLVQVELDALERERHGVGVLLVTPRKRVSLHPSFMQEHRRGSKQVRRIDQHVDVDEFRRDGSG